jgi:trehalose/maltose hydrolase-like predicted phosphorylase
MSTKIFTEDDMRRCANNAVEAALSSMQRNIDEQVPKLVASAVAAERERWQKACGAIAGDLRNQDMVRLGAAKCLDAGNRA